MGVVCQIASNCLLSITIDCYRFLLIDNRLLIFSVTSISAINRYQWWIKSIYIDDID